MCPGRGATPARGWDVGCPSVLERASLHPRRGPGAVGGLGKGGLGRSWLPQPRPAAPLPCNSAPRGCSCRGAGGGWSAVGLMFAPGRIFSCLARPAYLHLCLFAGCSRLADLDPLLSGRVKTGTVLTIGDDNKSPHVAVCGSATLHFQPSTGRPSFLYPPSGQRPAASLASHAGVPPPPAATAAPRCSFESVRPHPRGVEATSSALAGERVGRRGAIRFLIF